MTTPPTAPANPGAALGYVPFGRTPGMHEIDWSAAAPQHKRYPGAKRFVLDWEPAEHPQTRLGRLLRALYGLTRIHWVYPVNSLLRFISGPPSILLGRPVPSGGALYPLSLYLATGPTQEVPPGLYHYDAAHHTLDLLRTGDHRAALATVLATHPHPTPHLVLVIATRFWRTAFKYREFGYRLQTQETGVLIAQALALTEIMDLSASVHLRFADEQVNRLLGLETFRESVMALLTFTGQDTTVGPGSQLPTYEELLANPIAVAQDQLQDITETLPATAALHTSSLHISSLPQPQTRQCADILEQPGPRVSLPAVQARLVHGIANRASPMNGFTPKPLNLNQLATILQAAGTRYPCDLLTEHDQSMGTFVYCLLLRVDDIAPGAYRYLSADNTLAPVSTPEALHSVLTDVQLMDWTRLMLHEASMALVPVGNYESGIPAHGDRWYRMQNIEAGIMIHRATLAATAVGLTARIVSDGTRDTVDYALGLTSTPNQSLSMLLIGHRRPSPMFLDSVPGATIRQHQIQTITA